MSTGDVNPYSAGPGNFQQPASVQNDGSYMVNPLVESAGWIKLMGWFMLVGGIIYCLTIIGLVIGWLPIWIGYLMKRSSEHLQNYQQTRHPDAFYLAAKDMKTTITIFGVLTIINIAILVLYIILILMAVVFGGIGALAR